MQMYSEKDVDTACLEGRQITILGYGSQGRAHALNLKDSGHDVVIGARAGGGSFSKAEADGFVVKEPLAAVQGAAIVAILTPDTSQAALYNSVEGNIGNGAALLFAHGFNIHFKQIAPRADLDVVLIAPKGPGDLVRRQYEEGHGVPLNRTVPVMRCNLPWRTHKALAEREPVLLKPRSPKKQKPICSASRRCSVAVPLNWLSPDSTRWSKPVTSLKSLITKLCTN